MTTQQLTDQVYQFIDDLKRERQRKQAASAKGRALNCMELEDRILLSASPIAPQAMVNKEAADVQQTAASTPQSVAADSTGNHIVVWSSHNQDGSGWGVYAQRFNADGVAQGSEMKVNERTQHDQQDAKVAMRADGTFVITWTDSNSEEAGSSDIYARSYDANGNALQSQEFRVHDATEGDQKFSSVAINNNGLVVTWSSQNGEGKWDLFERWFDVSGNPQGSQIQLNSTSSSAPIHSQLGMDPWGYVAVVWQSEIDGDQNIFARYGSFANGDVWDTGEFQVNTTTTGNQYNPNMGFKSNDGNFVVSWTSDGQDGGGSGIYAQRFDAYGSKLGSEFRVNTTTADNQDNSSVAVNNTTGDFIVTWSSYNQDALGGWGVYSRSYSADGTPKTDEIRVSSTVDGSQNYSSAAYLSSGSYVITWSGEGTGDDAGVFSQICHTGLIGQYYNDRSAGGAELTGADIGAPSHTGSTSFNGRTWTLGGGGTGIGSTADQFNFASQDFADNGNIFAKINSLSDGGKAGLMFRNDASADSAFAGVFQQGNTVSFQWRGSDGAATSEVSVSNINSPVWLNLYRNGNNFSAYYSYDNITWIQIGDTHSVSMNSIIKAGLAVTAGNDAAISTGVFSNVTVVDPRNFVLAGIDIGTPGRTGSTTFANGAYGISGGGSGIGGTADKLQFGANGLAGDWDLTARIMSVEAGATAGAMFRNDNTAGSMFAGVFLAPDNTLNFQWRTTEDGSAQSIAGPTVSGPVWVKVTRDGNNFQGWYSTNGSIWTQIGTTQTIAMNETVLGGLAVTSNDDAAVRTATFSNVAVSRTIDFQGTGSDIGVPDRNGTTIYTNGESYVISGSGSTIGGSSDQFHFSSNSFAGEGTLVAQVSLPADAGAAAKAGLMFRNDTAAADSLFADVVVTAEGTARFEWRDNSGFNFASVALAGYQTGDAVWLKLTRADNGFSGYYSTDGVAWTQIGVSKTIAMNTTLAAGLAVCSGDETTLIAANFNHVAVNQTAGFTWTGGDIGGPSRTGSEWSTSGGTYVVSGGIAGQGQTDPFHFSSANFTGDGSLSAQVASWTNVQSGDRAGVMFRNDSTVDSPFASVMATTGNTVTFQWQDGTNSGSASVQIEGLDSGNPVSVKLNRAGGEISGYYSLDGNTWIQIGATQTLNLSSTLRAGVAVSAHEGITPCIATFKQLTIAQTNTINLTSADIGAPGLAGSTTINDGVYTIIGSGNDISGTSDQFQFASESLSGNAEMIVRVDSLTNTQDWAMNGLMFREDNSAGSKYAMISATPGLSVQFQWRDATNGGIGCVFHDYTYTGSTFSGPMWLKLVRTGNEFRGYFSDNGVNWVQVGGTPAIAMSKTVQAGLAVAAANTEALATTVFSHLSISQSTDFAFSDSDVGIPATAGSTATPNEGYIVTGGGADVYGSNQHFHYSSESHTGDGEIIARVDSLTNTGTWAMGGVMFRDSNSANDPTAPFAMVFANPNSGVVFQWSSRDGNYASCYRTEVKDIPVWVKLVRVNNEFSGFYSMDGVNWTQIGTAQSIGISQTAQVGLYACANNDNAATAAQFSQVSVSQSSNFTWTDADVGGTTVAGPGTSIYPDAHYVNYGGGYDTGVFNGNDGTVRDDQFQYTSEEYSGDLTFTAKITSFTPNTYWSKAGIMFRNSLDSNSTFAGIFITPESGIQFHWRTGDGKEASSSAFGDNVGAPVWVKLVRSGSQFTGFYSTDNVNWIQVGSTQTIAMNETIRGGLAVCAGNTGAFANATFNDITVLQSRNGGETNLPNVAFQQATPVVDFNWGNEGSPAPGIGGTNWSASWQGKILADRNGTYTFSAGGDDGVRIWINDQLVVDGWQNESFTYHYGSINLTAGQWYSIRMDYYQANVDSAAQLWWATPGQNWQVIPASHLSFDNMPPVNQVPAQQVVVENTPLIFSAALGNAIRVTDADACYGPLEVTISLTPGSGTLSLSRTNGLSFSNGDGVGDVSMTFIGTLDDINAALDGLHYTPATNYLGQANLQITTNDMAPAFTGGSKSDTKTVSLNVASAQGFLATYYNNTDFSGTAVQTVDSTINFQGNGSSPIAGIDANGWSVRWMGNIEPTTTGSYTFHVTTDSGCRVWINNQLVIDRAGQGGAFASDSIVLTAGQSYLLRMEYAQSGTGGQAKLEWSSDTLSQQVIASDQVNHLNQSPSISLPGNQSVQFNAPLIFSTANGNAISVGHSETNTTASSIAIGDSSFETVNVGTGSGAFNQSGVIGSAWNFEALTWDGDTPNCSGVVGPGSAYDHPDAPAGDQVAFVQGNGAMWQELNFAESGFYSISFQATYRQSGGQNAFKVMIDGMEVGVFNPNSSTFQGYRTDPIAISAGTHRLTFQSMSTSGDHNSFIDRVSIAKSESLVQVTLSVDPGRGQLSLGSLNGLVFTNGDGANDPSMTFSGSLADVNAAMEGMQFIPAANSTGTVELHVTTSDLMSPLAGGPQSATDSITLNVSNASIHSGLLATYYNWDSTADPVYRIDSTVDVNWNSLGSPAPGIVGNNWNASWEGKFLADYSETYTFHLTADDGARLWINGSLLVNAVNNQTDNTFTGTINLEAGQWYSIRMEYYQHDAGGSAKLQWSSASQSLGVIPTTHLSCADLLAHQNAAPVNNLPSQQVAGLNTPFVFSTTNGNAISVSDPNVNQANATVTVPDGSFEAAHMEPGYYSNQYNPTGSAWTFEGLSGLAANDSGILNQNGAAPNGTQVAFVQSTGSFYQDIDFAQAGNYTISFQAAYRVYGGASPVSVFVDGVNVGTFTSDSIAFQGYQSNSFAVTAGTHRVTFSHATAADQTVFIDRISIAKTESLVQVTLALDPGAGILKLAHTDGLVFLRGDGIDDAEMTFSGTLADINAALNGLRYMPAANYTGTFNLHMSSTHPGTIFTGGSQTDADSVPVYVSIPSDSSGLLGLFYNGPGGANVNSENLAIGKTVTASSSADGTSPSNIVNGNLNDFSHSATAQAGEWVQIDLSPGTDTELTQIKIYNRADGCGDRLQHFMVSVIDHNGNTVWSQNYDEPTYDGQVLTFNTGNISGEYVKITKTNANWLHLSEVQVYNLSVPEPDVSRVDPTINFNWGNQESPAPGLPGSQWSASWQGKIQANYSEDYTFHLTADDGVRLWVNGQLLIDSWQGQNTTTHTGTITLEAGQSYAFRMDYYQVSGQSGVQLEWSSASQAREIIPSSQFSHSNSAPVNYVPSQQTTDENTPLVFSTANGNAIRIEDVDAVYGPVQVTLTVDHGTLTLNNPHNLTFSSGDGAGDATMTFFGQLADINAALEGMTYTPTQSGSTYISSANLQITTDDMAPALTGGSKLATSTVAIDIHAPWQYNGLLATYYNNPDFTGTTVQRVDTQINFEGGNAVSPAAGIDGNTFSARWLGTITADYSETYTFHISGDDGFRLYVNNQLLVDRMSYNGEYTYTGTIDLVAGQANAFRLDYCQLGGGDRVKLEWSSASQAREVICSNHFLTADQTPAITTPPVQNGVGEQPIVFSESLGNVIAVSELHNNGNPLTVTIAASQGSLTLGGASGLTFLSGDGADDATMTFTGSITDINAALSGLCYTRAAGNSGSATLEITATDPATPTGSRSSTSTVAIGAVQQSNSGLLVTYYSDRTLLSPVTVQINDVINGVWGTDWGNEQSPAPGVPKTGWSASWEGFIEAKSTETYTFYSTTDDGVRLWVNGQLLINHWGSQYATTYTNSINLEAGQKYSFRFEYFQNDGPASAKLEWSTPTMERDLISANQFTHAIQSPVNFLPASQNVNEDSPLVFSSTNGNPITIVDIDAESNPLSVTLTAVNGTLSLGGRMGISFTAGDGVNDASVTFTGSLADINAALNGLIFQPAAGYTGPASLRIVTTDLYTGLVSNSAAANISVLAVNHAPTNTVPSSQNVNEHQTLTFSTANGNAISVGDPDIGQTASSVTVGDSSFESPNLGAGGNAYQYGALGTSWTFSGTSGIAANGSNFNNANAPVGDQVGFIQNGGAISQNITFAESGTYTIGFEAAYRNNGAGMNPVYVEVDGVVYGCCNPASTDFQSFRTAAFSLAAGTHNVTFRGVNPGGDRTTFIDRVSIEKAQNLVQVSLAVDIGKFTLGNTLGIVINQGSGSDSNSVTFSGSLQDVNAALEGLQYVPMANYEGADTLRITTNDLGNVGVGGPKSTTNTVAIQVLAVNDPPVNTVPGTQGTYVNHSITFTDSNRNGISITDADIDASSSAIVVNDGSFESPSLNPQSILIAPSGTSWTFTNFYSTSNTPNASGIATAGGNNAPTPIDGRQTAFIQGAATLSQDVIFTKSGEYNLSLLSAYRSYYTGDTPLNPVKVLVDGQEVGTITPTSLEFRSYQTNSFSVAAGAHRITFVGLSPVEGDHTTFIDQISINPANTVASQVQVTLSAEHGALSLSGVQGLTFLSGDGSADAAMTIRGTLADINAALSGLRYDPTTGYVGSDSIHITTNDLGNRGLGGAQTTTSTIGVDVAGGPVVNSTTTGTQQTFPESPQAVAADANGNYVVVWSSQNQDGDGWGVYARQFNAAGIAQGNEFQVNTQAAGDQMYATVAMNADGSFVVTWSSNNQDGNGWGVYGQRYDAGGNAVGSEFQIASTTASDQMYSSVAINDNGDFAVTWSSKNQSNGNWDVFGRVFHANGEQSEEFRINEQTSGDQMYSRLAMNANGAFTVVWQSQTPGGDWDIYARSFDSSGAALGNEFRVNDTIAGNQENASIAMNASGSFVISWTNVALDGNKDIYARQFNADGTFDRVYTVSGSGSDIWGSSDHFHYVSEEVTGNATMIASVDSFTDTGYWAKAGIMFRSSLDPAASNAMIYVSPNNTVVFHWRTSDGVGATDTNHTNESPGIIESRVYLKLTRVGDVFSGYYSTDGVNWIQVGTSKSIVMGQTYQAGLEVSSWNANALATATFKHVSLNGRTDLNLVGRDIGFENLAGSDSFGSEFRVNSTTAGDQDYSSVAMDRRGNFFVTWSSNGQDTPDAWGVYGRRYNADAVSTGVENRINATTDGSQSFSSVTALSPKDFLVVWSGNAPGDTAGVFQAEQCPPGLLASYFHSNDFSGTPERRIDSSINFNYGTVGSPFEGVMGNNWSARWEGLIRAESSESYTFYVDNANSVKLWINGQLVIGSGTTGTISLVAGQWYSFRMDYRPTDGNGRAAKLQWSSDTVAQELIPSTQFTFENPAPVHILPASQSVNEDNALVFSTAQQNAISISDLDVAGDDLEVTLSVNHGTLTLGGMAGLTFLHGDGAGDSAMTFRGTLNDINAALNGLQFMPASNYNGLVDLQITTNDLGSTGMGGAKVATSTLAVHVVAVNDAPVNTVPGQQGVIEHQTLIMSNATGNAIRISDVEAGSNAVRVTLSVDHGRLTLSSTTGLTFASGNGANAATITMTGTIGDINAALDGLQFRPEDNYDGIATLQIITNDLGNTGIGGPQITTDTVAIAVTAVNDPPAISAPRTQEAYTQFIREFSTENGNAIRISDPDASNQEILVTMKVDQGFIFLPHTEGLTFFGHAPFLSLQHNTGSQEIMMRGTLADINAALDGLQFKSMNGIERGTAHLQILVNDLGNTGIGGAKFDNKTIDINIARANEPPTIAVPGTQQVLEHQTVTFDSFYGNGITIGDPDANGAPLLVTLTADHGTLSLSGKHGLTFVTGDGVNDQIVSFIGSIDNINAALEGLQFQPVNNYDGPAGVQVYVNDLGNTGAGGRQTAASSIQVKVTAVNDPPTIDMHNQQTVLEHQELVFSQAAGNAILVGDSDAGNTSLQVTLSVGSGTLTLGGTQGLTFAQGSGPTGSTMTFTGSIADINAALDGMKFVSASTVYDETVNFQINVNDLGAAGGIGGAKATTNVVPIRVIAVNDAPTITLPENLGADPTQMKFSNATDNAIVIGDPESGNNPIMLTLQASEGKITLATTEGLRIIGGVPAQSSFVIVVGTIQDINRAIDGLVFQTDSPYAQLQIIANDLSSTTGVGGPKETSRIIYAQRIWDPNFTPSNDSGHFQQLTGVLAQNASMTAQEIIRQEQLQAKLPTLDQDQVGASLFLSDALQNANGHLADAVANQGGTERLIVHGNGKTSEDTFDLRDAKAIEEAKFSADTQNMTEPVQLGTSLRRDENLLVGLGIVSAGYLAWAFNGGSLLAGAISTTPMWKPFDPLAVLDFNDRASNSDLIPLDGEAGITSEDNLQSLFG
jgi:hypothetical protein